MILESRETEIETSGNFKEFEFGIKQTDMDLVIEILRSKMYKNPIAAICREISSNSRDANRESQNESPIEIGFQDSPFITSEICIYFKDKGLGISPDRMADVFVNYGASTKRESNEFTGGFGLGAKTPFSYTDNFWIETVFENVRYSYCAAIEEGKKGKIFLISSKESVEDSGTTIIVPIKSEHRRSFEEEVYKATFFWPQKPIYTNFYKRPESILLKKIFEDNNYLVYNDNNFISGHFGLLLDGIYYNIDSSVMDFADHYIDSCLFIFKFNVGELTISANRESLQYDEKTKNLIQEKFNKLLKLSREKYKAEYDKRTTWIDSYIFYVKQARDNIFLRLLRCFSGYEGIKEFTEFNSISFKKDLCQHFPNLRLSEKLRSGKVLKCDTFSVNIKDTPVYILDKNTKTLRSKDLTIFKNYESYFILTIKEPKLLKWQSLLFKEKKSLVKIMRKTLAEIEKFKSLGLKVLNYSEVPKTKTERERVERSSKTVEEVKVFEQPLNKNWQRTSTSYTYRSSSKLKRPGYYDTLLIENNQINITYSKEHVLILVDSLSSLPDETEEIKLLRYGVQLGLIPNFSIYFANKTKGTKCLKFFKTLEEKTKECINTKIITEIMELASFQEIKDFNFWEKIDFKSNELKKFKDEVIKMQSRKNNITVYITSEIRKKYGALNTFSDLIETFNKFKSTCKILELINSWEFTYKFDMIKDYVLLVEKDLMQSGLLK